MDWRFWEKKKGLGKKVFVGVSGGVDSSVTLALLKQDGYDVTGVFIRTWHPEWLPCDWKEDRRDAIRVCAHLGVPFLELDLEEVYKREVSDEMIAEYRAGRTPNPDVLCNRSVKFGAFWEFAQSRGADFIATGHYAQVVNGRLSRGNDSKKDQSYFLWTLTDEDLEHILFPIGHLPKPEVRLLAQKHKLPTATKRDSQGICFLGHVDLRDFLSRYIDTRPGVVLDAKRNQIGVHPGALFFTLGERHGFTITHKTPHDKPYHVIGKDMVANTITVSQDPIGEAPTPSTYRLVRTVFRTAPAPDHTYIAQIRYHGALMKCVISLLNKTMADITFETTDYTIASGQSVVVYDGDICIGGGIVSS